MKHAHGENTDSGCNRNTWHWLLVVTESLVLGCGRVANALKRHHDHGSSNKGKQLIGANLPFQRFIQLLPGGFHGGTQADMVLEKK